MEARPQVGVGIFIWKNGKFLMGKRKGAHGTDTWSVPGGYIEYGESWTEAARREVFEETGMKIKNVRFVTSTNNVFPHESKHTITIWLDSDWVSGKPKIKEPDKFVEQEWRSFNTLPKPLFEPCWKELKKQRPDLFK